MSENILNKPYTDIEYADFAVNANSKGQKIEFDDNAAYALYPYEELQNGQIADISNTDEYKKTIANQENTVKFSDYTTQIEELEKKIQRSLIAKISGIATDADNSYFNNYMSQIETLRTKIAELTTTTTTST